ncbi:hypothetical protein BIW11_09159 [Tropilaelaps mercedesae]|uniref:Uncharacterized protein n=1 Tax=Tropilaelaps mercedesae TaxID=418985 RepID=A0A1V9XLQ2_9ACAR|nr:hypothetical protein BIW11_09159 [Tropilaelaps mercedesae]
MTRLDHFCAYERDLRRQVKLAEVQSQVLQQKMAALEMANERIKAQIHTEQDDESPVDPNVELKKRVEIQRATLTEQRRLTEIKTLELRRLDEQKAADDCIINKEIREASDATDLYRAQSAEEWSAFCNALQNDLKARQDFVDIELRKERRRIQQVHSGCRELSRTDQLRFDEDQKARAMTIHKLRITRGKVFYDC